MTDGQESRTTEEILPLSVGLDTECETLLPNEGNLVLSGATMDKDDDGTLTAATSIVWIVCIVWSAATINTAE